MAINSGTQLTKYVSTTTVITAAVANTWYGGLFGTTEGAACAVDDPLVAGHVHDGVHQDGHAQKIDLVNHVTNQLRNSNLADNAVLKRNIQSFEDPALAIPEFEIINGTTFYYLDLSDVRAEIVAGCGFATELGVTSNSPGDYSVDDLVFGSDSLDDDGDVNHFNRLIFDKSTAAFRAGRATGAEWDSVNRGNHTTGFGRNSIVRGQRSTVAGGDANSVQAVANNGFVGAGDSNSILNGDNNFIGAGNISTIDDSENAFVGAGYKARIGINANNSAIVSGTSNIVNDNAIQSFVGAGFKNQINSSSAGIVSGDNNTVWRNQGFIGAGSSNRVGSSPYDAENSAVVAGLDNKIALNGVANNSSIVGGSHNQVRIGSNSFIGGGDTNLISSSSNSIVGGENNSISAGIKSFIGGGDTNSISLTDGGQNAAIVSGHYSTTCGACFEECYR